MARARVLHDRPPQRPNLIDLQPSVLTLPPAMRLLRDAIQRRTANRPDGDCCSVYHRGGSQRDGGNRWRSGRNKSPVASLL
jgi:hypothetical protein